MGRIGEGFGVQVVVDGLDSFFWVIYLVEGGCEFLVD